MLAGDAAARLSQHVARSAKERHRIHVRWPFLDPRSTLGKDEHSRSVAPDMEKRQPVVKEQLAPAHRVGARQRPGVPDAAVELDTPPGAPQQPRAPRLRVLRKEGRAALSLEPRQT